MSAKIMARRANNLKTPLGQHWTVQKIVVEKGSDKHFGFAISDDGETTAFIPRPVVMREQMTTADEGAGFTAPTRAPSSTAGPDGYPQIMLPISWDGEKEEIEIDEAEQEPEDNRDFDGEIDALIDVVENAVNLTAYLDSMLECAKRAEADVKQLKASIAQMHNHLTAHEEWLRNTYPEGEDHAA